MPRTLLAIACSLLMLPGVGQVAHARDRDRLPEAVTRIERETGGRVLSAERRTRGGREVSRIKVYTPEGRIRILWDDPTRDREREAVARDRDASRERNTRPGYDRGRSGIAPRPADDGAVVQRALRPEPTPLPEPRSRRDDGSPRD
jgi:hypothetical protein